MADLERALASLEVEWPATPAFDLGFEPRTRRRRLVVAALAVLAAVAIALAVPPARSAILRIFHLGGESIERVDTLPRAQERSLRETLGAPITHDEAERLLVRPFGVPRIQVYRAGIVVSALLEDDPPVILSELYTGNDPIFLKKLAGGATSVEQVTVGAGMSALWIHGARHVFTAPNVPPRYARNVLIWLNNGITFRLEGGASLTLAHARALARSLR